MANVITSELLKIFNHCVYAVLPHNLIRKSFQYNSNTQKLTLIDKTYDLLNKNVYVVGTGKAVLSMAKETEVILGSKIKQGIVSVPVGTIGSDTLSNGSINYFEGAANNLPDISAETTAKKVMILIQNLGKDDFLLVLLSGGGSALLPLPREPITLNDKLSLIKDLANAGADIKELNTVRKILSSLKGGQLSQIAQPAQVVSLILSDIVGDPLDLIASGPTCKNYDSPLKAKELIIKYNLYSNLSDTIKDVLNQNTKCEEYPTENVSNYIIGSNKLSIKAAMLEAKALKYHPIFISNMVTGNVKIIAHEYTKLVILLCDLITKKTPPHLAKDILNHIDIPNMSVDWMDDINNAGGNPICLVLGGETTVEVKGSGMGGRNQQLVLEFMKTLHSVKSKLESFHVYFLSAGTDGIDGPTDAAGAIGYLDLISDACNEGYNVDNYLNDNDSYNFFKQFKNGAFHIKTGHTNTNVMDIHLIVIKKK